MGPSPPPPAHQRTTGLPAPRTPGDQGLSEALALSGAQSLGGGQSLGAAQSLGDYQVMAELGRGAQSTVYRVRRPGAAPGEPEYALKILDTGAPDADQARLAFHREAALLAGVDHPGLAAIHEVGRIEGRPFLVMDLLAGVPLVDTISAGPLPPERVIALALDVIGPLTAVHAIGLIHRDLKPHNIMVLPSGEARLIDFGLATRHEGQAAEAAVGTLAYCPPEQSGVLKRPVDNRSDLYSLGVVLFECLTGELPFVADEVGDLLRMHAVTPAPDLRDVDPRIPPGLAALVARLLAKDPDDRYQNGDELAADLRDLSVAHPSERTPAALPTRHRGFSGRAHELAELNAAWQGTLTGAGRVCTVRGPGGAGKSRLAAEVAERAHRQGLPVLHGRCSPDDPVPLAALRAALEAHLTGLDRLPGDRRDAAHLRIRAAAGQSAGLLAELTPTLKKILTPRGGDEQAEPVRFGEDQFILAVAGFLAGLAADSEGLLLLLDDLQWLDPGTARVLGQLCERLPGVPLMVLTTARDDEQSAAATDAVLESFGTAVALDLTLAPMTEDDVADLVAGLLPGIGAGHQLTRLLAVRGAGNPFVTKEYLRAIVDAGLLRPFWGDWLLDEAALDDLELPQDALGLVLTRIATLGAVAHGLLVTAAAIGTRFRPELVAAVHPQELESVLDAMVEAAGRQLIERRDDGRFAFLHDRIREALHDELDAAGAAGLHQRIAETLDFAGSVTDVYATAHHFMLGDGSTPQRAFAACWAAGEAALRNHAPAEAVGFLRHAARIESSSDGDDPAFAFRFGEALKQDGQYQAAREQLDRGLSLEPDPLRRARILAVLADVYRCEWSADESYATIRQGLAELGARLPGNPLALVSSTALMFAVGRLKQLTGLRLGDAGADDRTRAALAAELHSAGAYVATLTFAPDQLIANTLRGSYWAARSGPGPAFADNEGLVGMVYGQLGLPRLAAGCYRRMLADPCNTEPATHAQLRLYRSIAGWFSYELDDEPIAQVLHEQDQLLEMATYCDALFFQIIEAAYRGRTQECADWLAFGRGRLSLHAGDVTAMTFAPAIPAACTGRPAEATAALREAEHTSRGAKALGMTVVRCLAQLIVLTEQDETGTPFDAAVAEFEALGVAPGFLIRPYRGVHFQIAMGRLAQCRAAAATAAATADLPARLSVAAASVRTLGRTIKDNHQAARHRIAAAELLTLQGFPEKALTVLDSGEAVLRPDSPMLAFEAARVRARALAALDAPAQSRRAAETALRIAEQAGWPHRAGWTAAEFSLTTAGRRTQAGHDSGPAGRGRSRTGNQNVTMTTMGRTGTSSTSAVAGVERQRLRALEQVGAAASRVLDPGALARIALDETIKILAADRAFLFLIDDAGRLTGHLGRDAAGDDVPELTGYSASLVERVRVTREPLVVTGTEQGAAMGAESVVLHGLRSIMAAPLQLEGRLLGVVYLDSQVAKGIFTADDVSILIALTNHIATSLETARAAQLEISVQTARRQRDLTETLRRALEAMAGTFDPQEVLDRLQEWVPRLVSCEHSWVLADETQHAAEPFVGNSDNMPDRLRGELTPAASWICLPLAGIGLLVLASDVPGSPLVDEIETASALAAQAVTAHQKATLFAQVQALAVADELTGIANRRRFFEIAARDVAVATRSGSPLTALMVDIDHFKRVNDTMGHPTGDDVIRVVAQRLAGQIRGTDLIGRYGGEEFALILPDTDAEDTLPQRLRACIADEPVPTRSGPLEITVSIGVAHLTAEDARAADATSVPVALLARSDQALYRAKRNGRNQVAGPD